MGGESKEAIVKMLEAAEESYRTKPQKKAKDLNIGLQDGSTYYLFQGNHMTPASSVMNENNVLKMVQILI
ncbi:hypothetical protein [Wolbachia pipientis]|uniref:hypothetical protein n=1 Tax=Wolbachia pipientis TaxID=955 RepID=UPI0025A36107|nr:hypothetical protein [Wolbachia pipientis]MDM8335625.1 hypothetical protein [Wolbachia pipientis]